MEKVYVLLDWWYEGDSNLVDSFMGVFKTYEEALKEVEEGSKFITFINYKTRETSNVYLEGYSPVEYGGYGSKSKIEIREINLNK